MKKSYAAFQSITGIFATYLALSLVLIVGGKSSAVAGGALNPPSGEPAPTMKSLEEIEPRILLDPAAPDTDAVVTSEPTYHFMIMKPGSYYLADDFVSKKPGAILINSPHVTLDLNGFHLTTTENADLAIGIIYTAHNSRVMNGSISEFHQGIHGLSFVGPGVALHPQNVTLENLSVSGASILGIAAGQEWLIRNCTVNDSGIGISAYDRTHLENVFARNCQDQGFLGLGDQISLINCKFVNNVKYGIELGDTSLVRGCQVFGTQQLNGQLGHGISGGRNNTIINTQLVENMGKGLLLGEKAVLKRVIADENGGAGIELGALANVSEVTSSGNIEAGLMLESGAVRDSILTNNGGSGIEATANFLVENCVAQGNQQNGFTLASNGKISNSEAFNNVGQGIQVTSDVVVKDNTCRDNTVAGAIAASTGNHIEGNSFLNNGVSGLGVLSINNLIIKNKSSGSVSAYEIAAGNAVGAVVGTGSSSIIAGSNGSSSLGSTDPWANFSY